MKMININYKIPKWVDKRLKEIAKQQYPLTTRNYLIIWILEKVASGNLEDLKNKLFSNPKSDLENFISSNDSKKHENE